MRPGSRRERKPADVHELPGCILGGVYEALIDGVLEDEDAHSTIVGGLALACRPWTRCRFARFAAFKGLLGCLP